MPSIDTGNMPDISFTHLIVQYSTEIACAQITYMLQYIMVMAVAIFFVALYNIILLATIGFVIHALLVSILKVDEDQSYTINVVVAMGNTSDAGTD